MKIQLLTTTLLLVCQLSFSQVYDTAQWQPPTNVTTETEYKYIKNLMREIDEKGADPKRGYYVIELPGDKYTTGNSITVKELRRENDSTIAGTYVKIFVTGTFSGNGTFYFCLPSPSLQSGDSYGWDLFFSDLNNSGNTCKDIFLKWLADKYSVEKYYRNPPRKKRKTN